MEAQELGFPPGSRAVQPRASSAPSCPGRTTASCRGPRQRPTPSWDARATNPDRKAKPAGQRRHYADQPWAPAQQPQEQPSSGPTAQTQRLTRGSGSLPACSDPGQGSTQPACYLQNRRKVGPNNPTDLGDALAVVGSSWPCCAPPAAHEVPYLFRTVGPSRMGWTDRMNSVRQAWEVFS